ncbi:MAG: hypothetical protein D6762_02370, partial [Candidatus Neomarinimicrobiota bacterium]
LPPFAHGPEWLAVQAGIPFFVEKPVDLDLSRSGNLNTGSYTINHKYIKYTNVSDEVSAEMKIILIAETTGSFDTTIPIDAVIKAQFIIFKTLEIY